MFEFVVSLVLLLFATAGGALGRRLAGGLIAKFSPWPVGTQGGRAVHGVLAGATLLPLVLWTGQPWFAAALIALAILLGNMIQAFPMSAPDFLGRRGSIMIPTTASEVAMTSVLNGLMGLAPMLLVLNIAAQPPWWLLIAAALHGPAYWAATLWQPRWRWCDILNRDGILEAPPLAELYVGGLRSHAIGLTLLLPWGLAPDFLSLLAGIKEALP